MERLEKKIVYSKKEVCSDGGVIDDSAYMFDGRGSCQSVSCDDVLNSIYLYSIYDCSTYRFSRGNFNKEIELWDGGPQLKFFIID